MAFPYAGQIYNMIPRPFRDYGEVYANAPRLAYEKKMADEKMQMDRDELAMRQESQKASIMDKHFQNALQLVKIAGPQAGLKYLDQYVPGHGISFDGYGKEGELRFKSANGNGGAGANFAVTTNGWVAQTDKNGRYKVENGILTMVGPNKQRVDLKLGTPEADKWFADNKVQNPIVGTSAKASAGKLTKMTDPDTFETFYVREDEQGNLSEVPVRRLNAPASTTVTPTSVEGTVPTRPLQPIGPTRPRGTTKEGPSVSSPSVPIHPPARRITEDMGPKPSGDSLKNESPLPGLIAAPDLYFGTMVKNNAEQERIRQEKEKRRQYQ